MAAPKRTVPSRAGRPASTARDRLAARPADAQRVQRAIQRAINSGEIIAVGVLNLVKRTIVTALAGAQDVGAELGVATVAAMRGSIKAAYEIGGDLGTVAREAIRGTITAAEEIGGDLGGVAKSAARGAVKATGDLGGDVATVARRAVEGTVVAAKELGVDVGELAKSAAEGAIEAADRIGAATGRAVRTTLSETLSGVRALIGDNASPMTRRRRMSRSTRASTQARAARPRGRRVRTSGNASASPE